MRNGYGPNEKSRPEQIVLADGTAPKISAEPASPGKPAWSSNEAYLAAREALLNPRQQLRNAVALQVGQLNELSATLTRLQAWMQAAAEDRTAWFERSQTAHEALAAGLGELAEAKRRQEDLLQTLRQGLMAAKDEDTARLESGLRNLASAAQDLRTATEDVAGTGRRFQGQVREVLGEVERRLPAAAETAGKELAVPVQRLLDGLRPLTWIGGTVGVVVAADLLLRALK